MIEIDFKKFMGVLTVAFALLMLALNISNANNVRQLEERVEVLEDKQIETTIESQRINDKLTVLTYMQEDIIALETSMETAFGLVDDRFDNLGEMTLTNEKVMAEYAMVSIMIESYDTVEEPTDADIDMLMWLEDYKLELEEELGFDVDPMQQFYDDFDDTIEYIVYFYENDLDETHNLDTWFETNYPALYDRIMEYQ